MADRLFRQYRPFFVLRLCHAFVHMGDSRGATFETLRRKLVKIAVPIEEMKGKIRLAVPVSYPQAAMLAAMAGAITTRGT